MQSPVDNFTHISLEVQSVTLSPDPCHWLVESVQYFLTPSATARHKKKFDRRDPERLADFVDPQAAVPVQAFVSGAERCPIFGTIRCPIVGIQGTPIRVATP